MSDLNLDSGFRRNDDKKTTIVARKLLAWFRKHGRTHLPWRGETDPYRVLVSELMLQQTQVERVIPYYRRWLKRFPTMTRLARASETDVLKAWQGLGYYRRARSLKKLADKLAACGQKALPTTRAELEALPGIGAYTAGAVLSFALDQPEPAIDTNVRRVIGRVFSCSVTRPRVTFSVDDDLQSIARVLFNKNSPREINSALMDFGALVCTSRAPKCDACPLKTSCVAFKNGGIDTTTVTLRAFSRPRPEIAIGVLREGKKVYVSKHGALLIALIDGSDARTSLKALAREYHSVEIAVRPAMAHTTFNGKPASLHRCSLLYGNTKAIRIATQRDLRRLPKRSKDVLEILKLL
ncbi:MAG: A/G-specific adenine glycosylase [Planctomycetes bacterium]|nr:A/G-specific adenine glycosylase [Planctomycetota bacterium]NUQ34623.1 A/G-specific adenine glycosylase [Planctomycetaceae bacterium]